MAHILFVNLKNLNVQSKCFHCTQHDIGIVAMEPKIDTTTHEDIFTIRFTLVSFLKQFTDVVTCMDLQREM